MLHAEQKACASDAADQNRDLHVTDIRLSAVVPVSQERVVGGCDRHAEGSTRRIGVTEWYEILFQRLTPTANACVITPVSFPGWTAGPGVADRDSITCSN
jgi:hypothetical protein